MRWPLRHIPMMRAIAAIFSDARDAAEARASLEALDAPGVTVAGGLLGAAGQARDGAILLAIHIDTDLVDEAITVVERHRGEVIDVIRLRDPSP